jgi:hypothetical protein
MIGPDCVQQTLADASRPPPDLAFDPVSSTGLVQRSFARRIREVNCEKCGVSEILELKNRVRTRKIENTLGEEWIRTVGTAL